MDADTILPLLTFQNAIQLLSEGETGAGGALIRLDSHRQRIFAGIFLPFVWNLFSRISGFFAGCFVFCRKDLFEKVGGFPESYYAGEEIMFL